MSEPVREALLQSYMELAQHQFALAYEHAMTAIEQAAQNLMKRNPSVFRGCFAADGHFYFVDSKDKHLSLVSSSLTPKAKKELQTFNKKYLTPYNDMFGHRYRKMTLRWDNNKLMVLR